MFPLQGKHQRLERTQEPGAKKHDQGSPKNDVDPDWWRKDNLYQQHRWHDQDCQKEHYKKSRPVRGVGPTAAAVLLLAGLAAARRAMRGRKAKKAQKARGTTKSEVEQEEAPHATPRPDDRALPPEGVPDAADKAREQQLRELIAQRRAAASRTA